MSCPQWVVVYDCRVYCYRHKAYALSFGFGMEEAPAICIMYVMGLVCISVFICLSYLGHRWRSLSHLSEKAWKLGSLL